jgi:YihY family inner membrane protein
VSTASLVPETWELTGDDARKTLVSTGRRKLLVDAFMRMRVADGFSHARSLAFMTSLVAVQGVIALVGLGSAFGRSDLTDLIVRFLHTVVPGPAGDVLVTAVSQAQNAGLKRKYLALLVGTIGSLVTATTAIGQLERGLNRLYGIEQDRPTVRKYGQAFVLALTAGTLSALAFAAVTAGKAVGGSLDNDVLNTVWGVLRWPLGVALVSTAVTVLFRWCPRRHQPALSWLAYGAAVSVALWFVVTAGLAAFFKWSPSFGDTYGPLAGVVALMLWSLLSSIAVLFGAAVAAQLEAVRAGASRPQDPEKVAESEPDAEGTVTAASPSS